MQSLSTYKNTHDYYVLANTHTCTQTQHTYWYLTHHTISHTPTHKAYFEDIQVCFNTSNYTTYWQHLEIGIMARPIRTGLNLSQWVAKSTTSLLLDFGFEEQTLKVVLKVLSKAAEKESQRLWLRHYLGTCKLTYITWRSHKIFGCLRWPGSVSVSSLTLFRVRNPWGHSLPQPLPLP